eukprot:SAG31_NODE_7694_length_1615_cov_1.551451_1_plen_79_part_10
MPPQQTSVVLKLPLKVPVPYVHLTRSFDRTTPVYAPMPVTASAQASSGNVHKMTLSMHFEPHSQLDTTKNIDASEAKLS